MLRFFLPCRSIVTFQKSLATVVPYMRSISGIVPLLEREIEATYFGFGCRKAHGKDNFALGVSLRYALAEYAVSMWCGERHYNADWALPKWRNVVNNAVLLSVGEALRNEKSLRSFFIVASFLGMRTKRPPSTLALSGRISFGSFSQNQLASRPYTYFFFFIRK